ncbi:CCA tRNA nucleotidyltransferase [Hephaestia sp. GCM10023244]|uniref:CCA tRNA nucleotidyltransferase n=1 Tax=unclassified Hephaestia TaxID=2631281 RepID=UPI00207758D6|nr:CCA tRNA nucleotidyltransferase [Hephaestia sp. MAHUQ-44]MCM8731847.1 CCA tRNA nucleotidyltransferase [Hephaestia sp. MAHUQ-44]
MDLVTLPDADWRQRADMVALADVLGAGAGETRVVGGAVRDTLLGLVVADVDLATRHPPQTVLDRLRKAGIKAVPTGLAHGTVTAVLASGPVEVTTLRRDVATDGRHAIVDYTDDWREDAARRDFTINALYADPSTGKLFDYFDGLADLVARRVRFIGDPLERIAEDHLRILRYFRFHARFGDTPDTAGLDACTARANDLMALSRERIAMELSKLLVARGAVPVVRLMLTRGIFAPIVPEIDADGVDRLARLADAEAAAAIAPDPVRRLAALLPPTPETADPIAARLKLSNADRKRLSAALTPIDEATGVALAYRRGTSGAIDALLLADSPAAAARLVGREPPRLPVGGGALVRRGIKAGPDVARLLRQIERQWIDESFPPADRVEQLADQAAEEWLRAIR